MFTLLISAIFALVFAYFATQNTAPITLALGDYFLRVPIYLLSLGSLLLGFCISGVISSFNELGSSLTIYGKNRQLKQTGNTVVTLQNKVAELEKRNEDLRLQNQELRSDNTHQAITHIKDRTGSFVDRLRHSLH